CSSSTLRHCAIRLQERLVSRRVRNRARYTRAHAFELVRDLVFVRIVDAWVIVVGQNPEAREHREPRARFEELARFGSDTPGRAEELVRFVATFRDGRVATFGPERLALETVQLVVQDDEVADVLPMRAGTPVDVLLQGRIRDRLKIAADVSSEPFLHGIVDR